MDEYTTQHDPYYDHITWASQAQATDVLGPFYAGMVTQLLLSGLAFANFARYLATPNYGSDPGPHRALAWAVMTALAAVTALHACQSFWHGVYQERHIDDLFAINVADSVAPAIEGIVGALVEGFLLVRASQLFKAWRWRRAAFLTVGFVLICCSFLGAVSQSIANFSLSSDLRGRMGPFTFSATSAISMWLSAMIDVSLSLALIIAVRQHILGFNRQTDNALRRLIRTAAMTASFTAVFGTIAASLAVSWTPAEPAGATTFLAFAVPLPSLYVLSLLTTLSARKPIRRARSVGSVSSRTRAGGAARADAGGSGGGGGKRWKSQLRSLRKDAAGPGKFNGVPACLLVQVRMETVKVVEVEDDEDYGPPLGREWSRSTTQRAEAGGAAGAALDAPPQEGQCPRRPSAVQFLGVPDAT